MADISNSVSSSVGKAVQSKSDSSVDKSDGSNQIAKSDSKENDKFLEELKKKVAQQVAEAQTTATTQLFKMQNQALEEDQNEQAIEGIQNQNLIANLNPAMATTQQSLLQMITASVAQPLTPSSSKESTNAVEKVSSTNRAKNVEGFNPDINAATLNMI